MNGMGDKNPKNTASSIRTVVAEMVTNGDIRFSIDNVAVRTFPHSFAFGPHEHRFSEVDFIEDGTSGMLFGTEYVKLSVNDCILIFPDVSHYFFTQTRSSCTIVQVEFAIDNFSPLSQYHSSDLSFFEELTKSNTRFLKFQPKNSLSECIRSIREESTGEAAGKEEMLRLLFTRLCILLSREISSFFGESISGLKCSIAQKTQDLLVRLQNESSAPIRIDEVASIMGVSSRYLRREFSSTFGTGIVEYVTELRLRKARRMLEETSLSILEVALDCGFSSSQYFDRVFRKSTGMTPLCFRSLLAAKIRYFK